MNKFLSKILTLTLCIVAICSFTLLVGCETKHQANDYNGVGNLVEPYFQTDKVELNVNENFALVFSETQNVTWASEDKTIATVSNTGEVTAVAVGSTYVTATFNGKEYKCLIIVTNKQSFITLSFDKTSIENLLVGVKSTIKTSLSYEGISDLVLEWYTSNEEVVNITSSSNEGCEIVGVSTGSAQITAKYLNRVSAVCYVTVSSNTPVTFDGEIPRPNGFEGVSVSAINFDSITTDASISVLDSENQVELVDGAFFADVDNDGVKELAVFATLNGFDSFELNSTFEERFAYGILLDVFETDDAHQNYYLKNQKIYSAIEADSNGNFAVIIDNVPDGIYAVKAFVEYAKEGEIVIYESSVGKMLADESVNLNKMPAINSKENVVGRVYYGWSASVYNLGDAGGYSAAYLKTNVPTEEVDGKLPTVAYNWETADHALTMRLGVKTSLSKESLLGYQEFCGLDAMYFEVYMKYASTYQRNIKQLVGVNSDGTGIYEVIQLNTNRWETVKFDLDMLIDNYDAIFNPNNENGKGLVLLSTLNLREEGCDPNATNNQNVYYVGEVFCASNEYINQQKYGNKQKVNAISSKENVVARIYDGWSANIYDFSNAGDYSRLYLNSTVPTEEIAGKTPTVAYSWDRNEYYAIRLGVQPIISKTDLVKYKQYSELDTLSFELYISHAQYTYQRDMKVLVDVNPDGTGVYETIKLKTNEWNTVKFNVDFIIENYDTIFNPSNVDGKGLVLIATPNLSQNNNDYAAVDYQNVFYVGEVYLSKANISGGGETPEEKSYTITFVCEGADDSVYTVKEGEVFSTVPKLPTIDGYTYSWQGYDFITPITQNITVTAVKIPNEYVISFDLSMKSAVISSKQITVKYGEVYTLPTPTCAGYKFTGWKIVNSDTFFNKTETYEFLNNLQLVANWVIDESSSDGWSEGH